MQEKKIRNIVGPLRETNSNISATIAKKKKKTLKRSGTIESSNHEAGIEDIQFSIPNMRMKQNTR
jgi:hypothetical protein